MTKKIKIFHCKNCDNYFRNSSAVVTFRASIRLSEFGQYHINNEDGCFDQVIDSATNVICYECDGQDVEVIELEECPHSWRTMYNSVNRACDLCGAFQTGTVVYD